MTKPKVISPVIPTPKMSSFLVDEFMKPMHLSAYRVAKEIGVPVSRIQDIIHDRRKITADTSIRLGRLFGVSENYFFNIQNDLELREARLKHQADFDNIKPLH